MPFYENTSLTEDLCVQRAEVLTPDMKWSLERIVQVKKTEDVSLF